MDTVESSSQDQILVRVQGGQSIGFRAGFYDEVSESCGLSTSVLAYLGSSSDELVPLLC